MKANVKIGMRGEYRAVVREAVYDVDGNLVGPGAVLHETPWGKNLITSVGFDKLLTMTSGALLLTGVAGAGNTAPTEADTTLASYKGKCSTQTIESSTFTSTPDGSGNIVWERVFKCTFNPGAFGGSAVNIAEAAMAMDGAGTVNASTQVFSRGLLVDAFDAPTTVSVGTTEYLELFWRYTRFIDAEKTFTMDFTLLGVATSTDVVMKPFKNDPSSDSFHRWWANSDGVQSDRIEHLVSAFYYALGGNDNYNPYVYDGALQAGFVTVPSGNKLALPGSSYAYSAYSTGSKNRTFTLTIAPSDGNLTAGIAAMTVQWGMSGYQMSFDPPIAKKAPSGSPDRYLRFEFNLAVANV